MKSNSPAGAYRRVVVGRPEPAAHAVTMAAFAKAGQYVSIALAEGGPTSYFAIASPLGSDEFEFLVNAAGPVGQGLAAAGEHQSIWMTEPLGAGFAVENAVGGDVLILAAGSGLGPIIPLLDGMTRERDRYGAVWLYYGQARSAEFAFEDELEGFGKSAIEVVRVLAEAEDGWHGPVGYVQAVADQQGRFAKAGAVFACGVPALVSETRVIADARGPGQDRVFTNY